MGQFSVSTWANFLFRLGPIVSTWTKFGPFSRNIWLTKTVGPLLGPLAGLPFPGTALSWTTHCFALLFPSLSKNFGFVLSSLGSSCGTSRDV